MFGDRSELLRVAHQRISGTPWRYLDHVYGEREAGGTSLLFLSDVPLEQLGYPPGIPGAPLPSLTWEALGKIPGVVVLAMVGLSGLLWLTQRRNDVIAAAHPKPAEGNEEQP